MADMASYKAPPSILIVAPSGRTNLLIRESTLLFSSTQRIVVGRVAELKNHIRKDKVNFISVISGSLSLSKKPCKISPPLSW